MDAPSPPPPDRGEASLSRASETGASTNSSSPSITSSSPAVSTLLERSSSRSSLRPSASHRHSFVENLRNAPPSPRAVRHPSLNQQAVQGSLNNAPPRRQPNPRFAGRDWHNIAIGELVADEDLRWAEMNSSVEDCTKILVRNNNTLGVVLLRNSASDKMAVSTFDYNDLNAYLLVVIGMVKPTPENMGILRSIAHRAQERIAIPVQDIQPICHKESLVTLSYTDNLMEVVKLFGSGVRRVLITNPASTEVVGVLSQLRLLEFFWNESVNFPQIDQLYTAPLRDLSIGSQEIIAMNADRPLADALILMNNEGLTSVAIVDNGLNVVGNISTRDVQHLTSVTSFPLLKSSCMHFISVILSERGVEEGRDSFPVFHVSPYSTLAHTVAKLVATRSHRMWIVESPSPAPSAPPTPLLAPVQTSSTISSIGGLPSQGVSSAAIASTVSGGPPDMAATTEGAAAVTRARSGSNTTAPVNGHRRRESTVLIPAVSNLSPAPQSPIPMPAGTTGNVHGFGSVPASALPGAHLSGRLTGVVSLTDILNLFAKTTGLHPSDLSEIRARRRRSSSSSLRPSLDGVRTSLDIRR